MRLFYKFALILMIGLILGHQFSVYYIKSTMKEITAGPAIDVLNSPNAALLVIDIQNGYLNQNPSFNDKFFIDNTNRAIDAFRSRNKKVIFITMVKEPHSLRSFFTPDIPANGSEAAQIAPNVHTGNRPIVFNKLRLDAFSNPALGNYLLEQKIGRLYIVGMTAEYCVYATIRGALNRGFRVNVIPEAILAEGGDPSKRKMIRQYARLGVQSATLDPLNSAIE